MATNNNQQNAPTEAMSNTPQNGQARLKTQRKNKSKTTVSKRLMTVWPLLFGIGILSMSNGLQGTLLGLRANSEGFPTEMIGVIMAVYFCGYLIGCRIVPNLIISVGHIRVFAALASIASTSVLLHGVFVDPWLWIPIRLLTGFCFCGLFMISESWLNQIATRKQRGTIFSTYVAIVNGGMFAGQFMINLAPLSSTYLFILVSILISLALAPITLTNKPMPQYKKPETLSFLNMLRKYPLPMVGVFISGICSSTFLGLGPVYANMVEMPTKSIAIFIGAFILGNATLPMLLGIISDKVDRRVVIEAACFIAIVTTLLIVLWAPFYAFVFVLGGMIASLYSVSITYLHDQIKKSQIISASRTLLLFNAMGAMTGPIIGGVLLSKTGPDSLFISIVIYMVLLMVLAIYRNIVGKSIKRKRDFVHVPVSAYTAPSVMRLQEDAPRPPAAPDTTVVPEPLPPEDHSDAHQNQSEHIDKEKPAPENKEDKSS